MADPSRLIRKELAEFLPTQRAIRAFEQLFDLVPSELIELGDRITVVDGKVTVLEGRVDDLDDRVSLLENPLVISVAVDTLLTVDAYVIKVTANNVTITLPQGEESIQGRVWTIILASEGPLTIQTSVGDSIPTPNNAAETTLLLKVGRRGSAIALRYLGANTWGFS